MRGMMSACGVTVARLLSTAVRHAEADTAIEQ